MARSAGVGYAYGMKRVLPLLFLLLSGCGGRAITKADIDKPDVSLVYGYIDMKKAPSRMQYLQVKQVLPKTDKPYWGFGVYKDVFYHMALKPGSYQLENFGGMSGLKLGFLYLGGKQFIYEFPGQGNGLRINEPGLHFVGAYKFKKAGTFWNRKFDLEPVKSPSEKEILTRMLPRLKGTKWEAKVKARIAKLK